MSLLSSIKSIIVWNNSKSVGLPSTEGNFYPLTNTSYWVGELTRTDYLRLYTSWQYVAVSTIANTIGGLDKMLKRSVNNDAEILHKHMDLLTYDLIVTIISSLQLTWTCYLYKNMVGTKIDSLDFLRTDLVHIEENTDWSVKNYRYTAKNNNIVFQKDEIMDISLFSPLQTFPFKAKWVSPMQAVAIQAEMDATANRWNWNFFKNGASAWDILSTQNPISAENKNRLVSKWKSEFQWVNNSHKVAILDNWLEYQKMALSQKELDFVETRRFTRDEVFAIFKIPKSIVWVSEDVNKANAQTARTTYYEICISPLAKQLEEAFNRELFKWIWHFKFVSVVPTDAEQLTADLNNGAITINEYRQERWFWPIKDWDFLKTNTLQITPDNVELEEAKPTKVAKEIEATIKKHIKGTKENKNARDERGQTKRNAKVQRTDAYEIKYIAIVNQLFNEQRIEVMEQINWQKTKKINQPKMDTLINNAKWVLWLSWVYKEVFLAEWTQALNSVWVNELFATWAPQTNKWIRDNILLVAKEVNKTTKNKVFDIIETMNADWKGADAIAKEIDITFQEFNRTRSKAIARTEITRASTEAEIQAFEQSGVVEWKERFTAEDERTCPECNSMDWKTIWLRDNYIKKWETYRDVKYDYADIKWPALHVNCRCNLLPVVK